MKIPFDHPARKRAYTRRLFRIVAPAYRTVTVVLSLGRDRIWKRHLIDAIRLDRAETVCDIASGTGDLALLLRARYPHARIIALDQTPEMMRPLRSYARGDPRFSCIIADMATLPLKSGGISLVSGGYALRNAPALRTTLHEVFRVMKPEGVAAFLEFSKPVNRWAARGVLFLLRIWGWLWGVIFHGRHWVYGYIAESLDAFPDKEALDLLIRRSGFRVEYSRPFFLGITRLFILRKQGGPAGTDHAE